MTTVRCEECGDVIRIPVARTGGVFMCAACWEPALYGVGHPDEGDDVTAEQAQSIVDTAAEQIENDPRISIILIMRRARPPRTWREIGRKIAMSPAGAMKLYRRCTT